VFHAKKQIKLMQLVAKFPNLHCSIINANTTSDQTSHALR
jgi:hypothetical protein